MKRVISFLLTVLLSLNIVFLSASAGFVAGAEESYIPTPVDLTSREDFSIGVNSHPSNYEAYPDIYLEQQIHAIARMGSKWIRVGIHQLPQGDEWDYADTLVGLCNKYGLKIIMIIYPEKTVSLEYITIYCETFAYRYNGEDGRGYVDIFQVWNELDHDLMRAKYGSSASTGISSKDYYDIPVAGAADLPEYLEYFQAAEQGIHSKDSHSKFMVNFSASHCGIIDYFLEHGLKIDMVGWDLYMNYPDDREKSAKNLTLDYYDIVEKNIYNKYHVPFILCETNVYMSQLTKEQRQNAELSNYQTLLDNLYLAFNRPWIKAAIIYELLDQSQLNDRDNNSEAWYGLIRNPDPGGTGVTKVKNEKPIYKELQRLLGGKSSLSMIKRSTVDLKPYEKLVVETADDSEIGKKTEPDTSEDAPSDDGFLDIDWNFGQNDNADQSSKDKADSGDKTDTDEKGTVSDKTTDENSNNKIGKSSEQKQEDATADKKTSDAGNQAEATASDNSDPFTEPDTGVPENDAADDWDNQQVEKQVEEVIIEKVVNPTKVIKLQETTHQIPWLFIILTGVGLLVLAVGTVVLYIVISKKKK